MALSAGQLYALQMRLRNVYISPPANNLVSPTIPPIANQPSLTIDQIRLNQSLANEGSSLSRLARQAVYPADPTSTYQAQSLPKTPVSSPVVEASFNAPVGNQPTPPLANTPSAPSSRFGPIARAGAPMIAEALLHKPVGDLGQAFGENVLAPMVYKADEALGLRPNPQAKQALENATKRYELALKNRQSAQPFNTKGSASVSSNQFADTVTGVLYRYSFAWKQYRISDGILLSAGFVSFNQPAAIYGKIDGVRVASVNTGDAHNGVRIDCHTPQGAATFALYALGLDTSANVRTEMSDFQLQRADGLLDFPTSKRFDRPWDSPKVKDKEKNPAASPDYFPYFPTVQLPPLPQTDPTQNPAYDNRPYKEPEKPLIFPNAAIDPTAPTAPTATPNNGLGNHLANSTGKPVNTGPTNTDSSPSQNKNPLTAPLDPPKTDKPQTTPNTPPSPDIGTVALGLTGLGLTIGAIATGIDYLKNLNNQINNQTSPTAQQTNAKQGVCDAFQPDQCGFQGTKQAATEATAPIKDQTIANAGALSSITNLLATVWEFLQGNINKVLGLLDNQWVDRAIGVANLGMNIHNGMMLSNALGKTAAAVIDNVAKLPFFPPFVDSKGASITPSRAFGNNLEAFIINMVGQENYTNWQEGTAVFNMISKSAIQLANRTENLFAKSGKVMQKTGVDVSNIGNALLVSGVIAPNSFPKMAATKPANDPLDGETASDLAGLSSGVNSSLKGLKTITGEVLTVTKNAQKISTEFSKLTALFDADSTVRKNLKNKISTNTKKRAIYTIVDIKQIKVNANGRPNSNPFR